MHFPSALRLTAFCLLAAWLAGCATPAGTPAPPEPTTPPGATAPPPEVSPPAKVSATITVDQRWGDGWQPITILTAYAPAGPTTVRLRFSKPVRRDEVEAALIEAQSTPVRGLMEWENDRTLFWHMNELPPRLDFLLDNAHDQDGMPLPGGIPSLRSGEPPMLVEVPLNAAEEQPVLKLPPDILLADLTDDGQHINLMIWTPGRNRWDWKSMDLYVDLSSGALIPGRSGAIQPRFSGEMESWVTNPQATAVAGLRTDRPASPSQTPARADLMIMDLRGGRQQVVPDFIGRYMDPGAGDLTAHLAWSEDGLRVAGLSYRGADPAVADLIVADLGAGKVTTLMTDLPVPAFGARLNWAPDQRWLLAGNLLIDLQSGAYQALPGHPALARGMWAPDGSRLLYSTADWGPLFLADQATGVFSPFGSGMAVGWKGSQSAYVIRWPASESRYFPPGWQ